MWNRLQVLFHKIPFSPISITDSSFDLIKFEEIIKNFPNSLWIRPIFTIIPLIRVIFTKLVSLDFPPCGTKFQWKSQIAGDVAEYGVVDQKAWIDAHQSRGIRSTGPSSNARDDFATIDLINEIRWLWFNRAIREPRIGTWPHLDILMKIGRTKNRETWDCDP